MQTATSKYKCKIKQNVPNTHFSQVHAYYYPSFKPDYRVLPSARAFFDQEAIQLSFKNGFIRSKLMPDMVFNEDFLNSCIKV